MISSLPKTTHETLAAGFAQQIGEVTNAVVMIEPHSGVSRGFGFVTFARQEDFQKALAGAGTIEIDDRKLIINSSNRNKPHDPTPGKCK